MTTPRNPSLDIRWWAYVTPTQGLAKWLPVNSQYAARAFLSRTPVYLGLEKDLETLKVPPPPNR